MNRAISGPLIVVKFSVEKGFLTASRAFLVLTYKAIYQYYKL
jgi:hypothetical protein